MKKYLIFFILLAWASCVQARGLSVIGGGAESAGGGGCTTANDSALFDFTGSGFSDDAYLWGSDEGDLHAGIQFTTASTYTITEYNINITAVTTSGTVTAALYTDSSGSLGTIISGTSKAVAISTTGVKTFTLDTPKTGLTSGTYWLYFHMDTALGKINAKWINFGQSYRVFTNAEYTNSSAFGVGLYGCSE